ncbi:fluoride efflux transporter CrcB [Nocardia seriolae]|uniref:Fluoride-specific ion channel FluC n=1 Tax=Nocardia seriolae TaxID=37332 RepID=A0A0B8N3A9_9NOCA|nr:fluoride efflux transporter CrcB [Nocardia seriolae]MTJ62236.1 fluoride efflux transporter CrcB [Nocardia seriolae]MTJ74197.1 fluoride efflux transporter CrcB [Nocardia seriolae]MTJ87145.1 fluoride efflux transporter CrcB [Nocardia seriolae]MTK40186.1 fluoride efflux transporter CrcB [Nocardia seriolae]MTK47713.1 fluoride efflux transporter CrcB [Nocardia seriolae]
MTLLLVALGAMVGAPLRYLTDRFVQTRHDSVFPWGTFTVNIAGSLILGAITGAALSTPWMMLLGTGFCGALTTYSTFSFETVRLAEQRTYLYAALNITAGLAATVVAFTTTHALLT